MFTGTVAWLNEVKGYAFIERDNGAPDVFCHITAAQRAGLKLREGLRLSFDLVLGKNGRDQATNLRLADEEVAA
jgi:cold shock protein